ncbi:MAG: type II toxin-antitoxin system VapC family toxin [Terracidiphilus sp.]
MIVYVDTSFQIAMYVADVHSPAAVSRMAKLPEIHLTPFSRCEVANAIHGQAFIGRLSSSQAQMAWKSFESDCAAGVWQSAPFPNRAWETCVDLARKHGPSLGVRTLDSLHVTCALELKAQKFWTFDDRQARLAEAVGLDTTA